MIDVLSLLEQHNIPHRTRGLDVKRGNVNVKCPYCIDDPEMHLGINLETGVFGCWRSNEHKGTLRKLLRDLLQLNSQQITDLLGASPVRAVSSLRQRLNAIQSPAQESKPDLLKWPANFKIINTEDFTCEAHVKHLVKKRGYAREDINAMCKMFDLRYCFMGHFHNRVLFPLKVLKDFRGWTGRDITNKAEARYKTESGSWGRNVLYLPSLKCEYLIMQEGPFDSLKPNWIARTHGLPIRSGAFTGTAINDEKIDLLLSTIGDRKIKLFIIQDYGATANALRLKSRLQVLNPTVLKLPAGYKDMDEMPTSEVLTYLQHLLP